MIPIGDKKMKEEKRNIIYKYKIPAPNKHGQIKIEVEGWDFEKALHVGEQDGDLYLWAIMRKIGEHQKGHIYLTILPTGLVMFDERILDQHIGTVQMKDGLVFHVFTIDSY